MWSFVYILGEVEAIELDRSEDKDGELLRYLGLGESIQ